jgi:hypothetical protein
MAGATLDTIQFTPESCHEAVILRAYCESKFTVGPSTSRWQSVTGEPYTELFDLHAPLGDEARGFLTPEAARVAAQSNFDSYAEDKSGTLYWRVVPEIAFSSRRKRYAYYLRLLISNKPRLTHDQD